MKPKFYFPFLSILLLMLLSGSAFAQTSGQNSFDQSALLMLRSKNAMQGQDANELRQLAGYYEDYYTNMSVDLQVSGQDPDGRLNAAIVQERDQKVDKLLEQAEKLDDAREQKRRRNPNTVVRKVARFFGGLIKGGGRAAGFAVSKTMDGISRGTQIIIDEVGPKVIEGVLRHAKTVILSGGTLEGSALRTLVRELFAKHARGVLKARLLPKVARMAERVLGPQAAQAVAVLAGQGEYLQAGTTTPTQPDPEPAPPAASNDADSPSTTLNLTPQEEAAIGLHTYQDTLTRTNLLDGSVETSTVMIEREYQFTETGVDLYLPGHQYIATYEKLSPNVYTRDLGRVVLTFTNQGYTLESTQSSYTQTNVCVQQD